MSANNPKQSNESDARQFIGFLAGGLLIAIVAIAFTIFAISSGLFPGIGRLLELSTPLPNARPALTISPTPKGAATTPPTVEPPTY